MVKVLLASMIAGALLPGIAAGIPAHRPLHRIGVLAHRPKAQVLAGWQPLATALTEALPGCEFALEVLDYPELETAIAEGRLDLVITNPGHFVGIRSRRPGTSVLATVIEQGPGIPLPRFGGTIVARSDRADLEGLADLSGARIAAVGPSSLGGYQAQAHELLRRGLGEPRGDRVQFTGMPHDRVIEAVLAGQADAGFVRSGTIEVMAAEGRLDPRQLKVINRQLLPEFPYAVSTLLYPDWPVLALGQLDEDHARRIAGALLVMEHGGGVA